MADKCPKCGYEGATSAVDSVRNAAAAAGAATGAGIGSLIPGLGTAIGAGIGGFLGLVGGTTEYECKNCHHRWKG